MSVITYSLKTDGSKNLSTNFKVKEFACKDGSDTVLIDSDLVKVLQQVRDKFKVAVKINSAYRTTAYNKKVGGSTNSQHTKGTAADIVVTGIPPIRVALYIASLSYFQNRGGIGLYSRQTSSLDGFVHVDVRATKSRWTSKAGTAYLSVSKIMPTIQFNSRDSQNENGYSVTILQRLLNTKTPDGIFGNNTKNTLINWQKTHNLTADGIAGTKTWESF